MEIREISVYLIQKNISEADAAAARISAIFCLEIWGLAHPGKFWLEVVRLQRLIIRALVVVHLSSVSIFVNVVERALDPKHFQPMMGSLRVLDVPVHQIRCIFMVASIL